MPNRMKIIKVVSREVLDSRGNPTVETEIYTRKGISRAIVPSGASTGSHEALELRDGGKRYLGQGVQNAVLNVNKTIGKRIVGKELDQEQLDEFLIKLDGTSNKSGLGANAMLSVSMAFARATALEKGIPVYHHISNLFDNKKLLLPTPAMNVINGGKHAQNKLDFQEFMLLPKAKSFAEALRMGSETYHILKEKIKLEYGKNAANVGDEGGFAPPVQDIHEPLKLLTEAVEEAGYAGKIKFGLDCASSEFFKNGRYYVGGSEYTGAELLDVYKELVEHYPIISIEDPFAEDDFKNWHLMRKEMKNIQIVGDDLLVTNPQRIQKAIVLDLCNALLLKVNQIGTITEALNAAKLSMKNRWNVMVSHRSGETEDTFIADLAVGIGSGQLKSGAPCRSERVAKYNQLVRIEEELGKKARYNSMF